MAQLEVPGLAEDGPDSWEQEQKLLPSNPGAQFGDDVAMDGDWALVGAPAASQVHVYEDTAQGLEARSFPATPDGCPGRVRDRRGRRR